MSRDFETEGPSCETPADDRSLEQQNLDLQRLNQLILSSAGEGIYGLDCDGKTTFVNPAAARMLGWTRDELIGEPMHEVVHHTRSDGSAYPRKECPIYAAFKDGEVRSVDDEVFWRKDGTSFPVEYTSTPIHEDGRLVGAVLVFRNLTQIKQTEESLRAALAEVEELKRGLEKENIYLQEELRAHHGFHEIIGRSPAIREVLTSVETVADTDANVLIVGETGTGKELVARAVHAASARRDRSLIKVNCASIPRELFESEFFGHVKGAFTGALRHRAGRFELADGGTLFLDEVGEIPLEMQSKLLRVLQEGQFERIGDERTRQVDVRVVAATNRDLKREAEAGRFRQDLFYRLNVFPIAVPPLRDRGDDVSLLASYFLTQVARELKRPEPRLTRHAAAQLGRYDWPGNVRELRNVIERAVILARGGDLRFDLPAPQAEDRQPTQLADAVPAASQNILEVVSEAEMRQREKANLIAALKSVGWRIYGADGAAALLGVKPSTLASRIKKMGIERPDRSPPG